MNDVPSIEELRADQNRLRRVCGEVLNPGPWDHDWKDGKDQPNYCGKCRIILTDPTWRTDCPVPDPAEGPLEVIAEAVYRKCRADPETEFAMIPPIFALRPTYNVTVSDLFMELSPAERIICCLVALGKARVSK